MYIFHININFKINTLFNCLLFFCSNNILMSNLTVSKVKNSKVWDALRHSTKQLVIAKKNKIKFISRSWYLLFIRYGIVWRFFYSIFIAKDCFIVFFFLIRKKDFVILFQEKLNRGLTDQRTIKRINIRISQERLHVLVISIFFLNDCLFCLTTDEVNILE